MVWQATMEELRHPNGSSHSSIRAQRRSCLDWRDAPFIRWFMFKWWRYVENFDLFFLDFIDFLWIFDRSINIMRYNSFLCCEVCCVWMHVDYDYDNDHRHHRNPTTNTSPLLLYCFCNCDCLIHKSIKPCHQWCVCAFIYVMTNITLFPFISRILSSLFFSSHNIYSLLFSQTVLTKVGVF